MMESLTEQTRGTKVFLYLLKTTYCNFFFFFSPLFQMLASLSTIVIMPTLFIRIRFFMIMFRVSFFNKHFVSMSICRTLFPITFVTLPVIVYVAL